MTQRRIPRVKLVRNSVGETKPSCFSQQVSEEHIGFDYFSIKNVSCSILDFSGRKHSSSTGTKLNPRSRTIALTSARPALSVSHPHTFTKFLLGAVWACDMLRLKPIAGCGYTIRVYLLDPLLWLLF